MKSRSIAGERKSEPPRLLGQNTRPLQRTKRTMASGPEHTPFTTSQKYHGYRDRTHALYNVPNVPRLLGQNTRSLQRFKLTTASGTEHTPSTTFQTYHGFWDRTHALYNVPNLPRLLERNACPQRPEFTITTGIRLPGQNTRPLQRTKLTTATGTERMPKAR